MYNLYLFRKGKAVSLDPFLHATQAYRYAKNYAEDYPDCYVLLRKISDDSAYLGETVFDSRKQAIVDNYGRYEVVSL